MENLPEQLPVLSQELTDEDFRRVLEETPQPSTSQQVPEFNENFFDVPPNPQIYDPVSPPDPPYHIEVDESPVPSPNQNLYNISQPASPVPVPEIIIIDDESQNRTPRPDDEFIVADVTNRGQIRKNKRKMPASAVTSVKRKCDGAGRSCGGFRRDKVRGGMRRGGRLVRGDNGHAGDVAQVPAVNAPNVSNIDAPVVRQDAPQVRGDNVVPQILGDAPQVRVVDAPVRGDNVRQGTVDAPVVHAPQVRQDAVDAPVRAGDVPQVRGDNVRQGGEVETMNRAKTFLSDYIQKFILLDQQERDVLERLHLMNMELDRLRAKRLRLRQVVKNKMGDVF